LAGSQKVGTKDELLKKFEELKPDEGWIESWNNHAHSLRTCVSVSTRTPVTDKPIVELANILKLLAKNRQSSPHVGLARSGVCSIYRYRIVLHCVAARRLERQILLPF